MSGRWQDAAELVLQVGVGEVRQPAGRAVWHVSKWHQSGSTWRGLEPQWLDVSCKRILDASMARGRADPWSPFGAGTASTQVLNDDGRFSFQPDNEWDYQTIRPGRPIRFLCRYLGKLYPLWRGYIEAIEDAIDYQGATASLSAQDAIGQLHRVDRPESPAVGNGELSGARVNRILDMAQWPTAWRKVDKGFNTLQATVLDTVVGDDLEEVAFAEGGSLFADAANNVVFRDRSWLWNDPRATVVQAEIGPDSVLCPSDYAVRWAADDVVNEVNLARIGGSAQTVYDWDSVQAFGWRTYQRNELPNASDGDVLALARQYLQERARSVLRLTQITLRPHLSDQWAFLMQVDIGWRLHVTYRHPVHGWEWASDVHVQGVSHAVTPDDWVVTLAVDEVYPFITEADKWHSGQWNRALWS